MPAITLPVFDRMQGRFSMTDIIALTIADAAKACGIGRTTLYELIGAKRLDARKCGNRTLITAESLRNYVASLPAADIRMTRKAAA
jgi:excisionase family DNA binding protein